MDIRFCSVVNRCCCLLPPLLLALICPQPGRAVQVQPKTLTETLLAESAETLAAEARKKGDAIRGAILFPQQKYGCANCHGANRTDLLGPDLTQISGDVKDADLINAILRPSKVIRKGYETVTIVTNQGRSIVGRIINQTPDTIVLRDVSPERKSIEINRADIDELVANTKSSMPEKLADQFENRTQFLDVVRYVMEITAIASDATQKPQTPTGQKISGSDLGRLLIKDLNCSACHSDTENAVALNSNSAPNLSWSAGALSPDYITRFIANPEHEKPGTRMPQILSGLSEAERTTAAKQMTHFLISESESKFTTSAADKLSRDQGHELFHSVGCVSCHNPRDKTGAELPIEDSVPLGDVSRKYSIDSLTAFLKNPHIVRSSGRMPNMKLSHREAVNLSHFLAGDSHASHQSFTPNSDSVAAGKKHFTSLGCVKCHATKSVPGSKAPTEVDLTNVRIDHGCLSGESGKWPGYNLNSAQLHAIRSALSEGNAELTDAQQIAISVSAFRCVNCHERDEFGGVSAARNPHFQTANPNLGPQGRIPPTLTDVGAKLNPKWMRQVLVTGRAIRPYMKTRMPQFGTDNVAHLIDLFQNNDKLPDVSAVRVEDQKAIRNAGLELAGTGGLNCIACHTFQLKQAATMPAVDLTEMTERLKKDWFFHYMKAPQRLSLNTVMPSFWPGGRAIRKNILNGETDLQIEALWQYLLDGRQARAPRGLIRERMELLATDEAVMLRRSYQGVGKRGIGVGYPSQVNIVFDAEQMRLAAVWAGGFADTGGVFRSQGHGVVNPLSRPLRFISGPDVDDAKSPWVVDEGRPPLHHFKGYSLDEKRRPAFMYNFDGIQITDRFVDTIDDSQTAVLRRELSLETPASREEILVKAATGKKIAQLVDGTYRVDDTITIRMPFAANAEIVDIADGQKLQMNLNLKAGLNSVVLEYHWRK